MAPFWAWASDEREIVRHYDRTFENQFFRASGLNLLVAAIILWNTGYLEAAYRELRHSEHFRVVAPIGGELITLDTRLQSVGRVRD